MKRRVAASLLVALMILVMAVTPLSAVVRPGDFELPFQTLGFCGATQATALLHDETGMVQALSLSSDWTEREHPQTATRALLVDWDGDSDVTGLAIEVSAANDRYRIAIETWKLPCPIGVGLGLRFQILLRAPVDPRAIDVIGGAVVGD
jgi:hypothetical protein